MSQTADTDWIYINHRNSYDYFTDDTDGEVFCRQLFIFAESQRVISADSSLFRTVTKELAQDLGVIKDGFVTSVGQLAGTSAGINGSYFVNAPNLPDSDVNTGKAVLLSVLEEYTVDVDYESRYGIITLRRTHKFYSDVEYDTTNQGDYEWYGFGSAQGGKVIKAPEVL